MNTGTNTDTEKLSVSATVTKGREVIHEEVTTDELRRTVAADAPAYVRVAGGITKEIRSYEFVRIDVSIEIPCKPTAADVEATYVEAVEFVDQKLTERLNELTTNFGA